MALSIEFNGQSKRVRVTPGTTMFQVLEDARAQFQLSDTRQYQLLHRKRPVDLAIPFRLTGVSNNASLELQALASSSATRDGAPQQVRVCVQLADGKRVQSAFASDATLASILTAFALLPAQHEFALSFLQREISADVFATTTLHDLGIVSGSAIFRVQAAAAAATQSAAPAAQTQAPAPPAPVAPSSTARATPVPAPPAPIAPRHESAPSSVAVPPQAPREDSDVEMKAPAPPLSSYDALQRLRDSCFDAAATGAITTLMKIVTNVLSHPENEKLRSIRVANAAFQRSVGKIDGGIAFLESVGFALDHETQCLVLRSAVDAAPGLREGLRLLHVEADDLRIDPATRPQVVAPTAPDPAFDVYTSQIHRMQAQPRGPSVTEVLVDTLKSKQAQLLGHDIPPRNTVVSLPGRTAGAAARTLSSLPDADDDVAMAEDHPSDSRILISTLKAKRAEVEKAQNFRTQAMRELEELKKKKVFQTTLLRVQFPDRVVLQATFHPNETIRAVMDHVASCLTAAAATLAFHLYVTPPMQKLSPEKTLADLNLVPAALTYLSWIDASPTAFYLRDELVADECAESKSSDDAPAAVAYPKPIALEPQPATAPDAAASTASERSAAPKSATKAAGKKPAWLKLSR